MDYDRVPDYYAFHREEGIAETSTYAFCAYMLALPIILWLLTGGRVLRAIIFVLWLIMAASVVCGAYAMIYH